MGELFTFIIGVACAVSVMMVSYTSVRDDIKKNNPISIGNEIYRCYQKEVPK